MRVPSIALRGLLTAAGVLALAGTPAAAEIKVMISGGFSAAYEKLVREFERASGHKVVTLRGPSMGATPQAFFDATS